MALPVGVCSSTRELLEAHAHVWNHIFNYVNSMSLKCAVKLGIFDVIHKHGKPMTLSQLADALPINKAKSLPLYRLMRILAHNKFFDEVKISEKDDEVAYCLTPASRLLVRDEPLSTAHLALAYLHPYVMDPFQHLSEWFQDEHPTPFFTKHGTTTWEYVGMHPKASHLYNEAVATDAQLVASILAKDCKPVFEGLKTMVDVGGGTGLVAKAIADAVPGLKCILLELPHVVAELEKSENLSFVCGDMFESVPHADAAFLKWNLHMWNHELSVKLLRNCKEAVTPSKNTGGKVIIVEMVLDDQKEDHQATETQFLFDVMMMTRNEGGERTEKEWAKLFHEVGFTSYKITPALGLRSIIEVFP